MNKYYFVPVNDCAITHDGLNLRDHLWFVDKELYVSDCTFREFVYGEIFESLNSEGLQEIKKEQELEFAALCEEKGIPQNILLVNDGKDLYEVTTKENFKDINDYMLEGYQINPEDALKYAQEQEYRQQAKDFFKKYTFGKLTCDPIETSEFREDTTSYHTK